MSDGIYFDNFIITDDKTVADQWAADSWEIKSSQETAGGLSGVSSGHWTHNRTDYNTWNSCTTFPEGLWKVSPDMWFV